MELSRESKFAWRLMAVAIIAFQSLLFLIWLTHVRQSRALNIGAMSLELYSLEVP